MKVAVVGATGLVGTRMLEVLAERNFPVTELLPVASAKSVGRKITFQGKEWTVVSAEDAIAARPDLLCRRKHICRACAKVRGGRNKSRGQVDTLENGPDQEAGRSGNQW